MSTSPTSSRGSPTTRRFVRTAWIMLAFQLLAAVGAVGAGGLGVSSKCATS